MAPKLGPMLESIPDYRDTSGRRYPLAFVFALGIAPVLAGRDSLARIFRRDQKLDREALRDFGFDLTKAVKQRRDAEGISIPFPQRDVHLDKTEE